MSSFVIHTIPGSPAARAVMAVLIELAQGGGAAKRVFAAMMCMQKIDVAAIEKALQADA